MAALAFPSLLFPRSIMFDIENASRSGGASTNGLEQLVGSGAGRWIASARDCPVMEDEEVLACRAFRAQLRGRTGTVLVPCFDELRAPWPVDSYGRRRTPGDVRRGWLDGTPYADPAIPPESQIGVTFTAAAARRATAVQMTAATGVGIRPGMYFSPSPGRLHIVTQVLSGGICNVEPPLRDPVTIDQAADFATPTCEMRLASDDSGQLDLELARYGTVSLDFVEAF